MILEKGDEFLASKRRDGRTDNGGFFQRVYDECRLSNSVLRVCYEWLCSLPDDQHADDDDADDDGESVC